MISYKKKWKIFGASISSLFKPIVLWSHLWVTRKCNLSCDYCYVVDNSIADPTLQDLKKRIDKLVELGTCAIHLMGGEPTLRPDLGEIVSHCAAKDILVLMTTNATLLNERIIQQLGEAGVDAIELSVDAIKETLSSKKSIVRQEKALGLLLKHQPTYRYQIKLNMVLSNRTIHELPGILRFIEDKPISITIGLVMPPPSESSKWKGNSIHFRTNEQKLNLLNAADFIISQKKSGAKILDPVDYFLSFGDFLEEKQVWKCDTGKYFLEIDVDGKLLYCSYLLNKIDVDILDLDKDYYSKLKAKFESQLESCNRLCLANCFYDTSYFRKHPLYSLKNLMQAV